MDEEKELSQQAQPPAPLGLRVFGVHSSSSPSADAERALQATAAGGDPLSTDPDESDSASGYEVVRVPLESLDLETYSLPSVSGEIDGDVARCKPRDTKTRKGDMKR